MELTHFPCSACGQETHSRHGWPARIHRRREKRQEEGQRAFYELVIYRYRARVCAMHSPPVYDFVKEFQFQGRNGPEWHRIGYSTKEQYNVGDSDGGYQRVGSTASEYTKREAKGIQLRGDRQGWLWGRR